MSNDEQPNIPEKFLSPYDPNSTEPAIYKKWEKSGYFTPENAIKDGLTDEDAETFSMVLPPPNATGVLHIGHAAMVTIEDIMTRYNRMLGKRTLWIPGTDHAAIATEAKVTKQLEKEKIKKKDLGREQFLEKVDEFVEENCGTIKSQMKTMGASLDWTRDAFTLDEKRAKAVNTAFVNMYNDGLIYRGYRIVNWDPKAQTTVSDDEVIHEERKATLYTFKYSHDFPFTIATTRPETKLGDTGVAVHPEDDRYKDYIGNTYTFDFAGEEITVTVVADESVDPEFGTGAVGLTPAHSATDWDMAERHDLAVKPIINEYSKLTVGKEGIKDNKSHIAREEVVNWLKEQSLLENEETINQSVGTSQRSGAIIEPLPKEQWFVDVNKPFEMKTDKINGIKKGEMISLKEVMLKVVENAQINIIPSNLEKIYYRWIENLRDWCISRQIWYGHRIPVWYRNTDGNKETYVGTQPPEEGGWEQDPDTLDTWFSSGLWTFSTLGWPDNTEDLRLYHPTKMVETAPDIIFFWVARMILMSTYHMGEIPFKNVYFHGLIRDEKGRKISKSLGNNIDPSEIVEQYGADALRMGLIIGYPPGQDTSIGFQKAKAYKKFANKIWNATRFVLENCEGLFYGSDLTAETLREHITNEQDIKRLQELDTFVEEITNEMQNYKYHLVGEKLYHYFWHTFADIIIEKIKNRLADENINKANATSGKFTLYYLLTTQLKLLHPFMPFITEEIWQDLPHTSKDDILMIAKWPKQ